MKLESLAAVMACHGSPSARGAWIETADRLRRDRPQVALRAGGVD